ncbi:MAG: methyl-accepting chemotaxis protein [Deltaproteobacteria bacterium]|nr:methyl-accepting chemotaxis protein [Deltaproteobacteria bacterium]
MTTYSRINDFFENHLGLSGKMLIAVSLFSLLMLLGIGAVLYVFVSAQIKAEAQERIELATISARQMINQSVSHSIRSQLQATADRNKDILAYLYSESQAGHLTEAEAKKRASDILLSQTIGKTGYMVVIDSTGTLRVHPKSEFVNRDISDIPFVQQQIAQKTGYLVYRWKNPGEKAARPKSAAMSYFEPWDYIITASAYRSEFLSLISMSQFREEILSLHFGKSGYAFVMDTKGNLLIHPQLEGKNIYNSRDANGRYFIREICKRKNGTISYPWKNPTDKTTRQKDVVFMYYPELNIIVAAGFYQDELYEPLVKLKHHLFVVFLILLLLALPASYLFVRAITSPIKRLSDVSNRIAQKDLRVLPEFDAMETENKKWYFRFSGHSREIKSLVDALRDAGNAIRSLVEKLSVNAQKLSAQANVIRKAANRSGESASAQSSVVEEVSQTIDSLQTTFKTTEKIARNVFTVSEQAVRKGREGTEVVRGTLESMRNISKTSDAAHNQMTILSDVSNQIGLVVKSMEQIADNSQMLAINASIEAAEAGEAGKGFSVVAQEVQDLAIQSAKSTQHIRSFLQQIADTATKTMRITEESQISIHGGEQSLERLEKVLRSLTEVLDSNNQHADQIARTVSEQTSAISQISIAVGHVIESSMEGSENVSQLLKAVEELNRTRLDFERLASEYKI